MNETKTITLPENMTEDDVRGVEEQTEYRISIPDPGPLAPIANKIDWSRPLRTKGSYDIHQPVRIIAIDHSLSKAVIGVIGADAYVSSWFYNGIYHVGGSDCLDLENVPETVIERTTKELNDGSEA